MSNDTPKFFAIDNIDNAMNSKLGRELVKTLVKLSKKKESDNDKQVILTTHNPAILDGLNLNDPEQRLFVIYRNAYGHTKATRIFKTETPEGQRPLPLSEQFLRGYLGGLPDNF
jgi:AAA15 family ATPase/GTPase